MNWVHKIRQNTFVSYLLLAFGVLFALKWGAILYAYGYLLDQMQWRWIGYFVFEVIQGDGFLIGLLLALAYWAQTLEKKSLKVWLQSLVVIWLLLVFSDVVAMFVYQQRFSFAQMSGMLANADSIIWLYLSWFVVGVLIFTAMIWGLGRWIKFSLTKMAVWSLVGAAIVLKLIPLPILQVSGGELPVENVFAQRFKEYYQLNLAEDKSTSEIEKSDFLSLSTWAKTELWEKKQAWFRYAKVNPEVIFAKFPQKELLEARDDEWNVYFQQVLEVALNEKPELIFNYIDTFKDWKDQNGKPILKSLLEFAIAQKPQLAYDYLSRYEEIVESNEKVAKSLLEKATQLYENKMNFQDLVTKVEGRKNKKNLILVFFESASAIDSKRTGGLFDKFPQTDKISREGVMFSNMFANGVTSEMGHISTLMGVEPQFLGTSLKTGYERFTGVVEGLGTFMKKLGYSTHFVSTASLDFLNQRYFLKKVGFDKLREKDFWDWKHYTFNAAPDEALYDKTIDVVKSQTWSYFIGLQTISSHTPYSSPYGNSSDDAFRYMDESFAKFYIQLKKAKFFDNGVLVVVGDHRKMTPMEPGEYKKRWATADARIMAFVIGSGIKAWEIDPNLYQQTDIFYSLLKEFWSGDVKVLEQSNDIFNKEIKRNWAVRNFSVQPKSTILNASWASASLDIPAKMMSAGKEHFDEKGVANYMYLGLKYQKDQNPEEDGGAVLSWAQPWDKLIAHRGEHSETTENTMGAFIAAARAGAKALELDVSLTKDGKIVVIHWPYPYNTNCKQRTKQICEMTYEELRACKLNNGEDIFLFQERLPKIKTLTSLFFVDLKTSDHPNCRSQNKAKYLNQVKQIVEENQLSENVVYSSWDPELWALIGKTSGILSALDIDSKSWLGAVASGNYLYVMAPQKLFSQQFIEQLRSMKNRYGQTIIPIVYTVNDVPSYRKLRQMGIEYMMTDAFKLLVEESKK